MEKLEKTLYPDALLATDFKFWNDLHTWHTVIDGHLMVNCPISIECIHPNFDITQDKFFNK
jgi:hypothetical protein